MAAINITNIRNLVFISHGGTGKTSLVEALAFTSGAISRLGKVEDGNTVSDYDPDEQKRGMSIHTSVVSFDHDGVRFNLIDTPGYADFIGQMIAGASAADSALILVEAAAGVQVGTETAWQLAETFDLPRIVIVNRLDRENANWEKTLHSIQETLGNQCQPLHLPIGIESSFEGIVDVLEEQAYRAEGKQASSVPDDMEKTVALAREALVERIAETDDELTRKYLEGEELSTEEIHSGFKQAIRTGALIPIVCAAATKQIGSMPLLRLIAGKLPSPMNAAPRVGKVNGSEVELKADSSSAAAATIFRTSADEFVGRVSYFRVRSGTIPADARLSNAGKGKEERLVNLSHILGKELQPVNDLVAGDIGAVTKLEFSTTFDTLADKGTPVVVPVPVLPQPSYSAAITPKTKADVDKLGPSLQRVLEEDPTLQVERDPDSGETILSGLGESHLELVADLLRRKFRVEVDVHDRRVPYRETVTTTARAEYVHKKQSGGHGQYARVALRVEPMGRGEGFEFISEVVGGRVPRQYIPAVEKGVQEALPEGGVLARFPMTDLRVVLFDGKHHDVDSSEMAFKLAASQALKEATAAARPILLEPILALRIMAPDGATGDVMSDLNSRRARVLGMEPAADGPSTTIVNAEGPMGEFLHYATDLRSLTGGRGTFSFEFARYDPIPDHAAQKVVEKAKATAS